MTDASAGHGWSTLGERMRSGIVWCLLGCVSCGGVIADVASPHEDDGAGDTVSAGEIGVA